MSNVVDLIVARMPSKLTLMFPAQESCCPTPPTGATVATEGVNAAVESWFGIESGVLGSAMKILSARIDVVRSIQASSFCRDPWLSPAPLFVPAGG
jgi:hypothetical protein